ncbi:MAG: GNAT family N-acetyltransferase, partial [Armatimonadota bacterium]
VNVDPASFGRGVARRMIEEACRRADAAGKPLRLVSSAMNLDSYSLYTKAGFTPRALFQDMVVSVPESGLPGPRPRRIDRVRPARPEDVEAMASLEHRVAGVRREVDLRHFIENPTGIWRVWVCTDRSGAVSGWIARSAHPASRIAGPGAMSCVPGAEALLWTALEASRGTSVLAIVPADRPALVAAVAGWGGRNVELHVSQVRGQAPAVRGVQIPAFLPESG